MQRGDIWFPAASELVKKIEIAKGYVLTSEKYDILNTKVAN